MGDTPANQAAPPGAVPSEPATARSEGTLHHHVSCIYHGDLGTYDDKSDALQAAVDHLHRAHSSAVEAKVTSAGVQIHQVTHFTVADLDGYTPSQQN